MCYEFVVDATICSRSVVFVVVAYTSHLLFTVCVQSRVKRTTAQIKDPILVDLTF